MIGLNDFRRQWADTRADLEAAFSEVLESGCYILGRQVREFEEALSARWGLAYACGLASGLDAIEIGLRALGCHRGDAVLTTPLSAFATTLAILRLGAEPVFVDTDGFGLIDLRLCRRVLESRRDIRFFVPVHLYGHCLDMSELRRLRDDFSLRIVEDCAQSIGACFEGAPCGYAADFAAVSFYPTKNLGAIGDGGALLTSDAKLHQAARELRDYGQTAKYRHDVVGYNSRLDELQAAFMHRAHLPRLDAWTLRRRRIAERYCAEISHPDVRCLGGPAGSESVWHLFPVLVESIGGLRGDDSARAAKQYFMDHLRGCGIMAGEHYPILIPDQEALIGVLGKIPPTWPTACKISAAEVSLPIHPYLSNQDVDQVIGAVNRWSP